jgi:hypothetical protein
MQIINFLHYQNYDVSSVGERIDICPRNNTLDVIDKYSGIFRAGRPEKDPNMLTALWSKLEIWINSNFPLIDRRAVRYCTFHMAQHFVTNYLLCRNTVENLLPYLKSEVGVLCGEEMLVVEADWSSSLITLLAVIDVLEEHGKNITYYGTKPGIIENISQFSQAMYAGLDYSHSLAGANFEILMNRVRSADRIAYGLARRFLNEQHFDLRLTPKSLINDENSVGILHQFEGERDFEKMLSAPRCWSDYCISTSKFSKAVESGYFNFISSRLLEKILHIEQKFHSQFVLFKEKKTLILEEIIDIEAMAFVSAWIKAGNFVEISPHSGNLIPEIVDLINYGEPFISKVYVNSDFARSCIIKAGVQVDITQMKELNEIYYLRENRPANTIILIENDFIRRWGCTVDLDELISEVIAFLTILNKDNPGLKFIWKQRNNDSTAVFDYVKETLPLIDLEYSISYNLTELIVDSRLSISFGIVSNFSYDLVRYGLVNLYASFNFNNYEYTNKSQVFHQKRGPLYSARKARSILNNYSEYLTELQRQQKLLSEV